MMIAVAPSRPRPTVNMPATPPVRNATSAPWACELVERGRGGADVAAGGQRHADVAGDAGGEAAEDERHGAPRAGLRRSCSASVPSGFMIAVDVRNTMTASGTRMTAIVLNWRFRYAEAPSWIALAISCIFGVPSSCAMHVLREQTARRRWRGARRRRRATGLPTRRP